MVSAVAGFKCLLAVTVTPVADACTITLPLPSFKAVESTTPYSNPLAPELTFNT